MKEGNKSDKIDARKLADLLRGGYLRSVYHGKHGLRTLKELARSYLTISKDLTRVMNRSRLCIEAGAFGGRCTMGRAHERQLTHRARRLRKRACRPGRCRSRRTPLRPSAEFRPD
jgi:hypothetical protein